MRISGSSKLIYFRYRSGTRARTSAASFNASPEQNPIILLCQSPALPIRPQDAAISQGLLAEMLTRRSSWKALQVFLVLGLVIVLPLLFHCSWYCPTPAQCSNTGGQLVLVV